MLSRPGELPDGETPGANRPQLGRRDSRLSILLDHTGAHDQVKRFISWRINNAQERCLSSSQSRNRDVSLILALSDITYMPQTILSLRHHSSVLAGQDYFWTYYRVEATFRLIRIVALFIAATWLMKAGPSVESFLMPEKLARSEGTATN
jgi:hypothetical protein